MIDLGYKREDLVFSVPIPSKEEQEEKWRNRISALTKYIEIKKATWLETEEFLQDKRTTISGNRKVGDEAKLMHKTEARTDRNVLRQSLPSVTDFCVSIMINKQTFYEWKEANNDFKILGETLVSLGEISIKEAVNKGLMSDVFGKFLLSALHDHKERSDVTSNNDKIQIVFDTAFNNNENATSRETERNN